MKKLIVILGSLIALVLIVVIGGVAYLLSFDPNQNKALIASKFKEATGRTLALDGPITLSYYPWFGLSLDQVSISNADGFSAAPLLHANHLAARVKLLPLLSKSIEIDTVHVDGLALNLEVRGDGRNNWTFGDTAAPNAAPEESSGTSISDIKLILGGVDIRDTSLVFDDQFANSHYQLNNLNLQIGELVYGEPLTINMSLDAASRAPQLSAALALSGTVLYDLDRARYDLNPLALSATLRGPEVPSGAADLTLNTALSADAKADTLTLSQLELNALGSHLSATAEVKKFSSAAPSVDAKLDVSGDDLAVLLRVLGQSDLAQRVASLERSFKVQSSLTANMDTGALSVPALSAKLLGATIDGKVEAQRFNTATPAFTGELTANGPDLPLLLQVAGQLQGGQNALSDYGRQLRSVRDRSFKIQTAFTGDLKRGDINVPTLEAALLGFTLKGQLDAKDMNGGGKVAGQLDLRGDNLREVLTAIGQQDLAQSAQSLTLQAVINGGGGSFDVAPLDLNLVVAGPQVGKQPQTLGLKAATNVNLDKDRLTVDAFSLSGLGLNLNGKVQVEAFSGAKLAYTGAVQMPEFDARRLLTQLNLPPQTTDATVLQRVGFTGNFKGTANTFALNDLALRLDDSQLTGALDLRDLSTMAGGFQLKIDSIDIDRYLAPPATAASGAASGGNGDEPLPVDLLKSLNVQGEINAGQLVVSGLQMRDILVRLSAANGNVALNPINATLYEGQFAGNVQLNVAGREPTATLDSTLAGINLAPLMQDFMNSTYLSGKGTVTLALSGRGANINAIKRNLNGSGALNLADGVLSGIDVGDTLARVETMIRNKQLIQLGQRGGQTPFNTFAATLAVQNGVLSTNDLTIAAPQWGITGTGTLANLNDNTLNFNLVTLMTKGTLAADGTDYQVGGHALPIACTGSLSGPRCLPDVQSIFTAAVGNAVQNKIGSLLDRVVGGGQQQQQQAAPPANNTAPETPAPTPDATTAPAPPQEQQQPQSPEDRIKGALRGLLR